MSSDMSLTKWLVGSVWLATNCFAFNMSSLCFSSYFVIPSALVVTAFHHGYMFRRIRRDPGQAIPRKYTYTFLPIILLWLAGGAATILVGALNAAVRYHEFYDYVELSSIVSSFIAGLLSVIEAGLVIVIWRKCAMMKVNNMAGIHPLASLDNLDRSAVKP
ncbi:unnamed protein product [Rhizoctonia solani]|uniref:Transmembrane protein n=1 Tax=Rhizoctonia solani TaxID=456999 RepID=A0A8H3A9X9_9AGAM|nr:unnamed protein product [Rhizoctonia solani]